MQRDCPRPIGRLLHLDDDLFEAMQRSLQDPGLDEQETPVQNHQAPNTPQPQHATQTRQECIICTETFGEGNYLTSTCPDGHVYCRNDLTTLLEHGIGDQNMYPATCCNVPIDIVEAMHLVTPALIDNYIHAGIR